jgi:FtsH-binding integral membrane protein
LVEKNTRLERISQFLKNLPGKPTDFELDLKVIETLSAIDEADERLQQHGEQTVTLYQLIYSLAGLVLGLASIIGGVVLFLRGVTGSTSWTARTFGLESNLSDAGPGAVLFIVGLFMVFVTRFKVRK